MRETPTLQRLASPPEMPRCRSPPMRVCWQSSRLSLVFKWWQTGWKGRNSRETRKGGVGYGRAVVATAVQMRAPLQLYQQCLPAVVR